MFGRFWSLPELNWARVSSDSHAMQNTEGGYGLPKVGQSGGNSDITRRGLDDV